ncbi:MAG: lipoyl synthase [Acidimicrobiaceae bacterium]|nr:lipoyl synthase [Acidimicrobiaceae bacterium]MXZ98499.1 lipoyl synthase [Acidimicrobiaceae bacterium]MYE96440.1 lipoyl synthase [Acidimicrobiaceae bacterium]MYI54062.1 lipoyl synthase [Acidimicrobiaceae bacterium]MYJ41583.1 lipoyl synthase [Acidimicrobiaceae bacterium]
MRIRWLGRVAYQDALALQRRLHGHSADDHLLMLEHPHVVTLGRRGRREHLLVDVEALGGSVVETDRGGEVTYHGPGQLVGYPILTVPGRRGGGMADTAAYVGGVEQLLIDVLADLGLEAGRLDRHTGVWIDPEGLRPRKIAAIGVRLSRARSMHGFALNVDPDLEWFARIVPCGITGLGVTSLSAEGIDVSMQQVVDLVAQRAAGRWGAHGRIDRADVAHRVAPADLAQFTRDAAGEAPGSAAGEAEPDGAAAGDAAAVDAAAGNGDGTSSRLLGRLAHARLQGGDDAGGVPYRSRKPEWMRVPLSTGPTFHEVRSTLRCLDLVTVCEEAGCPNISECWNDGTATFMILGERCTRACGFCLVDTRRPGPVDSDEPERVAEAAVRMSLEHVVVTMVARDDLPGGGAEAVAATVAAVRRRLPDARVETLISDLGGDPDALQTVFDARPDVLNHNIETVARLQRAVRPSAGYARSLAVLSRAKSAGLTTKSSIIAGMGETHDEVVQTMADLHAAGTDIVTIGQYLRPSARHLPVDRWWPPDAFEQWRKIGESMGISHVESSPLTRSSYHARQAADAAATAGRSPDQPLATT